MLKFLRDPLVHFLALGGLLFLLYAWRGEPEGADPYQIVISDAELESMRQALAILHGSTPTDAQMWGMLEPNIKEEILYREAIALGLDQEDALVRTRLTEKMLFLTQDVAEPVPPTEEELAAFFEADPERFREPEKVTFEQVFFSPARHGQNLLTVAGDALERLRAGDTGELDSDESPLAGRYELTAFATVAAAFGDSFGEAMAALEPDGVWQGPLRSDFGMHLVRVSERTESYLPRLEDIESVVSSALTAQRRLDANEVEYQKLRARYEIVVNLSDVPGSAELTPAQ